VDEPIARWFPELRKDPDKRKQAITLEDLLTMRSGWSPPAGSISSSAASISSSPSRRPRRSATSAGATGGSCSI
jgi:CubicO group peptidase (beta-lactamase class C family)